MSKKRAGTLKFQDPLFSWLRTLLSSIQTFRGTTVLLILFLSFPFSSSLYRIHIRLHSTSSCQYICVCHSVLMPAIFASSCSVDTANWRLVFGVQYVQCCFKNQVLKFIISPHWGFLRGVSSLTNAPPTETTRFQKCLVTREIPNACLGAAGMDEQSRTHALRVLKLS